MWEIRFAFSIYRNPIELDNHIREQVTDNNKRYYVFIDEIQFVSGMQNPYVDDCDAKITFIDVLYNDLIRRELDVDVGVVEYNTRAQDGKSIRKQLEVDFVVNGGNDRFYVQSALGIAEPEKKEQEIASLLRIPDSFKKIVVVKGYMKPWKDEHGIQYVGLEQFLMDEGLLQ